MPKTEVTYNVVSICIGLIIPFVLFTVTAFLVVNRLLKRNAVELLNGISKEKKRKTLFAKSKLSFKKKYQLRSIIRNKMRTVVFLFGVFIASIILLVGFIMKDALSFMTEDGLQKDLTYEYAYYLNQPQIVKPKEGEAFYKEGFELSSDGSKFSIMGIQDDSDFMKLKTLDGKKVDLNKNYVGKTIAEIQKIKAGDKIHFINPVSLEEYSIEITDIVDVNSGINIFMGIDSLNELLGHESGTYNALFSDRKLTIDEKKVARTQNKAETMALFNELIEPIMMVVYILIILGVLIGIVIISITTNMIIEENIGNISMLKVLGYRIKEINKMIMNTNHILVVVGFLLGLSVSKKYCEMMLISQIETLGSFVPVQISITTILLSFGLVALSYFVSLAFAKRKVAKVNMMDSLTDYRE